MPSLAKGRQGTGDAATTRKGGAATATTARTAPSKSGDAVARFSYRAKAADRDVAKWILLHLKQGDITQVITDLIRLHIQAEERGETISELQSTPSQEAPPAAPVTLNPRAFAREIAAELISLLPQVTQAPTAPQATVAEQRQLQVEAEQRSFQNYVKRGLVAGDDEEDEYAD